MLFTSLGIAVCCSVDSVSSGETSSLLVLSAILLPTVPAVGSSDIGAEEEESSFTGLDEIVPSLGGERGTFSPATEVLSSSILSSPAMLEETEAGVSASPI